MVNALITSLGGGRLVSAIASGLVISLCLFWLMQSIISNNQHALTITENLQMTEFVRLKRERKLQTKDRKIPKKPPPEKHRPPPKMQTQTAQIKQHQVPQMNLPNLDIPLASDRFDGSLLAGLQMGRGKISTDVIPLVRIQPRYPTRAANRHIEGWVKLKFTITEQGTVKDAVVVQSHPSQIFNRAALQAISRWKFKAKVLDGQAFEQVATQTINFKLSK